MILLDSLRRALAKSFLSSIQNRLSRAYFYYAYVNQPDASSAPEADTIDYINDTKNNIFLIKEILPSDACFVIPRVDYVSGVSYSQYSSHGQLGSYVLNPDNFSIYVCTKSGSGVSSNQPTHLTTVPEVYADGYTWRYIYTVPLALRDRFLTSSWIPVSNSLQDSFFSNGGIGSVSILDSGEGYSADTTSISVLGANSTGSGAILEPVIQNGKLVSVLIHDPGYGYVSPTVSVLSPNSGVGFRPAVITTSLSKGDIRTNQALVQTLSVPGTIETVDVINGGSGYTSGVTLTLVGDGSGASITFERNETTGALTKVDVTQTGSGYTWAKIIITDDLLIGGSGAELKVNVSRIDGFGRDAVADLNATSIMLHQYLSREKINGLSLENTLYRFGVVNEPKTVNSGIYPRDYVTKGNYITEIPLDSITSYDIGDTIYNEWPTTANSKSFSVEEKIIGVSAAGLRLRALNGGRIASNARYFLSETVSFVATNATYPLAVDTQTVSACFVATAGTIDINTWTSGKVVTSNSKKYVVIAVSADKIILSSIDGGTLQVGDILNDGVNTLTLDSVILPILNKKSGSLLTIENLDSPIVYGPQQTVSFRTVIKF